MSATASIDGNTSLSVSASASTSATVAVSASGSSGWWSVPFISLDEWHWSFSESLQLVHKTGDHLKGRMKPPKYAGIKPSRSYRRKITLNGRGMKVR